MSGLWRWFYEGHVKRSHASVDVSATVLSDSNTD